MFWACIFLVIQWTISRHIVQEWGHLKKIYLHSTIYVKTALLLCTYLFNTGLAESESMFVQKEALSISAMIYNDSWNLVQCSVIPLNVLYIAYTDGPVVELSLNIANWCNGKVSKEQKFDFQSQFSTSKIIRIFRLRIPI